MCTIERRRSDLVHALLQFVGSYLHCHEKAQLRALIEESAVLVNAVCVCVCKNLGSLV